MFSRDSAGRRSGAGSVWQEAEGPPRLFRGQHLILPCQGRAVLQGPVGRPRYSASIVRTEEKNVHTSFVYFLLDLVY